MKKKILSVTASLLLLTVLTLPAGAVSVDVTDPDAMLPVDIIIDQDRPVHPPIWKTPLWTVPDALRQHVGGR